MSRVALVQMCSGPDPEENLAALGELLEGADLAGVDLVLTPENALVLGEPAVYGRAAEAPGDGPAQAGAAELARRHGVWLALGSFPLRGEGGGVHAASLLLDDTGARRATYEKLHLFDVEVAGDRGGAAFRYAESDAFRAGERVVTAMTPAGELGLAICYDLRFPPLFAALREAGAELLAVPAAFTYATGEAHWEVLLRARAIETQCFVLAAAQDGKHPDGRTTWGHSMAVDPWGKVLACAPPGPGVLVVDLDLGGLPDLRARMPVTSHARFASKLRR